MILEILAKVDGFFKIESNMEVKRDPYTINIFYSKEKTQFFLSIKKIVTDYLLYLPKAEKDIDGVVNVEFPRNDFFDDIIQIMQHIEAFGGIDKNISKIHWETPIIRWIPESENEHLSPFSEYERKREYDTSPKIMSRSWLLDTVLFKGQMGDLYIPFSFFREGVNQYHQYRHQSAFCTFYMMLEYFFYDTNRKYGIRNDAYKNHTALNTALKQSLTLIEQSKFHKKWLENELKKRNKTFDIEGLLFVLNRYRDELSHASKEQTYRNILKEEDYSSLAFISMSVCLHVSIKMRLLPFVRDENRESFLKKNPAEKKD